MRVALAGLALLVAGCAFAVDGTFMGRPLPPPAARATTILIIYNHGYSSDSAGTYESRLPPILATARDRNADVVVFSQVRNTTRLEAVHHASYIEAAVDEFVKVGVPRRNIILSGQSCGGWGALQAAAFTYPDVGGVVVFAPTCHGKLPHSTATRTRRLDEIAQIGQRAVFPGVIFVYEGDSYYSLSDWSSFGTADLRVERVDRERVLRLCARCRTDSHGAVWDQKFGDAYYEALLRPLIERVRARIRATPISARPRPFSVATPRHRPSPRAATA